MSNIWITDNHIPIALNATDKGFNHDLITDTVKSDLEKIAKYKIGDKFDGNRNVLVFPQDINECKDKIRDNYIISLADYKISTGNIMGFVGVNDTQLDIRSRFAEGDKEDFFLHYMLQKVFSINLFDIQHTSTKEQIFDFLMYLFPYHLKKALAQGLFKKYRTFEHNDANIRGVIDVSRHIRQNMPFRGTVAYNTRTHSYDNEITQLIRHTIEFIKTKPSGKVVLNNDLEMRQCVSQIVAATPTYQQNLRNKIIGQNLRPVRHPYFSAYTALQSLCIKILRHESIKFGNEKDKGAWLWEEYLATFLKDYGFKHAENKKQKGGFRMFAKPEDDETISKNSRTLYPDFWKDDYILDAKYKRLEGGVGREDLYQVVTYMYSKMAKNGGFIYPSEKSVEKVSYKLSGYGGKMHIFGVDVQYNGGTFLDYATKMKAQEKEFFNQM